MRAVRKDYFLDHDHSAYVDQWDWERAITADQRNLDFLKDTVRRIWSVLRGAEDHVQSCSRSSTDSRYPNLPEEITFMHAEDLLARYPDLPRKQRETRILQEFPAVFIIGIGWTLDDGYPHELRAADYDDWATPTTSPSGRATHGLNGDILVWNPVTRRRHELSSMGVRVDAKTLRQQLELTGQLDWLELPYHRAIVDGTIPLSIGGGIGQSRTQMLLLRKAHLGEVSVTVWPDDAEGAGRPPQHPRARVKVRARTREPSSPRRTSCEGCRVPADPRWSGAGSSGRSSGPRPCREPPTER